MVVVMITMVGVTKQEENFFLFHHQTCEKIAGTTLMMPGHDCVVMTNWWALMRKNNFAVSSSKLGDKTCGITMMMPGCRLIANATLVFCCFLIKI